MAKEKTPKGKQVKGENQQKERPVDQGTSSDLIQARKSKRKQKISNFEKAKQVYEDIQEQKRKQKEEERMERERRAEALESYNNTKKKMNKAIKKKNRKGQPNLGAQVEVLLEKMQKKIEKKEF